MSIKQPSRPPRPAELCTGTLYLELLLLLYIFSGLTQRGCRQRRGGTGAAGGARQDRPPPARPGSAAPPAPPPAGVARCNRAGAGVGGSVVQSIMGQSGAAPTAAGRPFKGASTASQPAASRWQKALFLATEQRHNHCARSARHLLQTVVVLTIRLTARYTRGALTCRLQPPSAAGRWVPRWGGKQTTKTTAGRGRRTCRPHLSPPLLLGR